MQLHMNNLRKQSTKYKGKWLLRKFVHKCGKQ